MKQAELSKEWLKITGDSHMVDIRRVGALSGATKYITKYITKSADQSIVNSAKHLGQAIEAFAGTRLITTFGSWRGLKLSEVPDEERSSESEHFAWRNLGSLAAVLRDANAGDEVALAAFKHITKKGYIDSA